MGVSVPVSFSKQEHQASGAINKNVTLGEKYFSVGASDGGFPTHPLELKQQATFLYVAGGLVAIWLILRRF